LRRSLKSTPADPVAGPGTLEVSNENYVPTTHFTPQPSIGGGAAARTAAGWLQPRRRGTGGATGRTRFVGTRFVGTRFLGTCFVGTCFVSTYFVGPRFLHTCSNRIRFDGVIGAGRSRIFLRCAFFGEHSVFLDSDTGHSGRRSSYASRHRKCSTRDRSHRNRRKGNQATR